MKSAAAELMSVAEFFDFEEASVEKHEYYQGQVYAMAGGTLRHSQIKVNVVRELSQRLRGKPCKPFDADLRVRIPKSGLITYPDASVVRGPPKTDDQDRNAITNPTVIVEVISETTEHYDRGAKFRFYQGLDSLREYVIVSQDEAVVEVLRRDEKGRWIHHSFVGLDATLALKSVRIESPLKALYEDVRFPPATKPSTLVSLPVVEKKKTGGRRRSPTRAR
jgi:Uma2 family endonuclease